MQTIEFEGATMAAVFEQEAHKLIDQLPDTAGWDDLIYQAALYPGSAVSRDRAGHG